MKKIIFMVILSLFPLVNYLNAQTTSAPPTENDIIVSEKNPALAFGCSFLIPGMGQMYNEEVGSGITLFLLSTAGTIAYLIGFDSDSPDVGVPGFLLAAGSWLYSVIDAPISANKITKESRLKALRLNKKNTGFNQKLLIAPYFTHNAVGISMGYVF